jgi:hypothetical protein
MNNIPHIVDTGASVMNEPVAWMQTYKNEPNNIAWTKKDLEELGESIDYSYIPLYTHPAKTLTDYEIKGVLALDECWIGEDSSMPNMIAFARAILRKVQEK